MAGGHTKKLGIAMTNGGDEAAHQTDSALSSRERQTTYDWLSVPTTNDRGGLFDNLSYDIFEYKQTILLFGSLFVRNGEKTGA